MTSAVRDSEWDESPVRHRGARLRYVYRRPPNGVWAPWFVVAPLALLVPLAHDLHFAAPSPSCHCPGGQAWHLPAPCHAEKRPAPQRVHVGGLRCPQQKASPSALAAATSPSQSENHGEAARPSHDLYM